MVLTCSCCWVQAFERIAGPNTERNLETCGILAGQIYRGELYTTHLIIPKQTSTSDTCSTECEEELVMYQHARSLTTLGWVHTHPTQTCFMSSVDLHTHLGYQVMLDEAVAIVLAPRYGELGVYRLTHPPGLPFIAQCREPGAFHPHPDHLELYVSAQAGGKVHDVGHVVFVDQPVHIKDLRAL
ncbi:hypothetical protein BCR44DRAFT_124588 [Catenaria anguillulae PL171]|uniref:MPN domain-containing protein n=1 Tax=Catenaria anguillulae PL171 TaxID=765915 RepID=A0A1Y2GNU7_9FUNG|nr:hypothetical protein BCR44DRAFT_124588 [Catenaria anguillulae PL171]